MVLYKSIKYMNHSKIIITLPYSPFSTCIKGSWNCTQNECQSTCHVYGEGHFRTFDGESYSFDGLCQYTFLEVYFIISFSTLIIILHMLMSTGEFYFQKLDLKKKERSWYVSRRGGGCFPMWCWLQQLCWLLSWLQMYGSRHVKISVLKILNL